jgi:hypothetical protein
MAQLNDIQSAHLLGIEPTELSKGERDGRSGWGNRATNSHESEVLLLTCIDFRFFHKISEHIVAAGLPGKFDHVIVAGAELGQGYSLREPMIE